MAAVRNILIVCASEFLPEVRVLDSMRLDNHETKSKCVYTAGDTVCVC